MVDPTLEHQGLGLSGRSFALGLIVKYSVLAAYGTYAAIVELPTFVVIGSHLFATVWAACVATLAAVALFGVTRTWATGRYRIEKWTTFVFVCVFLGYSFALIFRSISQNDWDSAPTALIPLAVCVFPTIRFYSFLTRGRNGNAASPYREVVS